MNTLELQDALGALNEAIDREPNRGELHFRAGNIQKKLGNLKAAAMAYARAIELDNDCIRAYNNLGIVFYELGEKNKALNVFRQGMALQGDKALLQLNYGAAREGEENPGGAVKLIPAEDEAAVPEAAPAGAESLPTASGETEAVPPGAPLPPPGNRGITKSDIIVLMYYLRDLSAGLTGKSREDFARSDTRLGLEYIIDTLEGRKGLLREIRDQPPPGTSPAAEPAELAEPGGPAETAEPAGSAGGIPNAKDLADTLEYLRNLAAALPDPDLGAAINRRVNRVITEIRQSGADRGKGGGLYGQ